MTRAIETTQLTKSYEVGFLVKRTVRALTQLDLTVETGDLVGLLGPNGAGKSTTIKLLLNLIRPSAGQVKLFGLEPSDKAARRRVGFLPENPAPYEYLTGKEFVTLAGELAGGDRLNLAKRVDRVIERVGMGRAANLQIRKYSKGMIQRISLAQALVADPELLILDEPTSGLDVLGRQLVRDIILEQRKRGTTVLFCSHIIPDVEALCDRVVVLIGGKLVRDGKVSELLAGSDDQSELVVDGIKAEQLQAVANLLSSTEAIGDRLSVRFAERSTPEVLKAVLGLSGRVVSLQRSRYSLEALFLDALKSSNNSVGSDIS
jgi:ABC-2 type transport system ATP-binding protein